MGKQSLVVLLILCSHLIPSLTEVFSNQFGCFGACGGAGGGNLNILGFPTTTAATKTEPPQPTTQNAFQRAGWQTDDKGNVFIGDDNAKLLLISVGSYWPFPKDYQLGEVKLTAIFQTKHLNNSHREASNPNFNRIRNDIIERSQFPNSALYFLVEIDRMIVCAEEE